MPCSASAGRSSRSTRRCRRARADEDPLANPAELLRRGSSRRRALRLDAGLDLVLEVGDADHENSSRFDSQIASELDSLEQRDRAVLGELEDAVVEVEPGELAVEVERRVVEVRVTAASCSGAPFS